MANQKLIESMTAYFSQPIWRWPSWCCNLPCRENRRTLTSYSLEAFWVSLQKLLVFPKSQIMQVQKALHLAILIMTKHHRRHGWQCRHHGSIPVASSTCDAKKPKCSIHGGHIQVLSADRSCWFSSSSLAFCLNLPTSKLGFKCCV